MYPVESYDWRAEEDARTLSRVAEIRNDPERMDKARKVIMKNISDNKKALGISPSSRIPGRGSNPATIMKLNVKY